MPTVAGTLKTFDQVGKKEMVEDIIYDISPTDTPMLTSIGTSTTSATLHQWLQDSLAPVATNANVEGADAGTASTITQTVKTANTQIFDKVVQVSGTAEAVGTYGRTSDLAYAIAKAGKEIKRDIEHSFVGAGQAGTAGNSSTARQLTSAANQISAATTNTAGSNRTLSEALVLDVAQKVYEKGGDASQMQVTPSHSVVVAGFATASGRQRDFGSSTTVVNSVDILVTPFGTLNVVPNRLLDANTSLILDTEYWSRAVLRPMQTTVLARTGDSDKRQMLTELTLVCEHDEASGKIDALTA
jgi:flagellar hook-length control protein FliK